MLWGKTCTARKDLTSEGPRVPWSMSRWEHGISSIKPGAWDQEMLKKGKQHTSSPRRALGCRDQRAGGCGTAGRPAT